MTITIPENSPSEATYLARARASASPQPSRPAKRIYPYVILSCTTTSSPPRLPRKRSRISPTICSICLAALQPRSLRLYQSTMSVHYLDVSNYSGARRLVLRISAKATAPSLTRTGQDNMGCRRSGLRSMKILGTRYSTSSPLSSWT